MEARKQHRILCLLKLLNRNSQNDRIAIHLFYISRENKKEAHDERDGSKDRKQI